MVKNVQALDVLINEHGVELKPFPEEVLAELKQLTQQLMNEKKVPVIRWWGESTHRINSF